MMHGMGFFSFLSHNACIQPHMTVLFLGHKGLFAVGFPGGRIIQV